MNHPKLRTGLLVLALLPLSAAADRAIDFRRDFSGSGTDTSVDVDGDGATRGVLANGGRGTFGRSTTQATAELLPFDGMTFCGPTNVLIEYRKFTVATRYRNGDVLAMRLDPSLGGTACFNFVDATSTFEINFEVVGGTGRFAGASGLVHSTGSGATIDVDTNGAAIQTFYEGRETGTLVLVGRGDDDDDDDEDDDD